MPPAKTAPKEAKAKAVSTPLPELEPKQKIELLRQMLLVRRFEDKAKRAFSELKIKGFCHLYIGQEAVAVGTISVLDKEDALITAYRDHGHALVRGVDPKSCMAELFGKAAGCSRGKGGSMHFFDASKHFYGGHGIVSGQTPLGLGLAFAQKYMGNGKITLCYLGDGAINQGAFHEALNMAALWSIPVIYIIENNEYSMGTTVARSSAGNPLTNRSLAYDMASITANGMDLDDVREKTWEAVNRARNESLPTLMEIRTYRYTGHSMSDPGKYRTKDELEERKKGDCIEHYAAKLIEQKIIDPAFFESLDNEVTEIAQAAYDFADKAEDPGIETAFEDIFAPEDQIPEYRPALKPE